MTNADRRQILRDRVDQISIDTVKLVLSDYDRTKTFSYKQVEALLLKCNSMYKEKLAELFRVMSLERKDESKEKIST